MKSALLLGAAAVALCLTTSVSAARDIKIATEGAFPPWNYVTEDGKLAGWDVDIANALCEEMKAKCQIMAQEWDGIIPGLLAQKYDMIVASMGITEKRKQQVAFTQKYKENFSQFLVPKDTKLDTSVAGMSGKRIGVQRGTIHDDYLTKTYTSSELVRYDKPADIELDLAAGRIDAMFGDRISILLGLLAKPEGKNFELVGNQLSGGFLGEGNGIALRKDDPELLKDVNAALDRIFANGVYDKITAKYFNFKIR